MPSTYVPRKGSKAQAAKLYAETFGRDAPKRMSGKAMSTAVGRQQEFQARLQPQRAARAAQAAPKAAQPRLPQSGPQAVERPQIRTDFAGIREPAATVESGWAKAARWATPALTGLAVGTAAVQGFHRAKDDGASTGEAVARGALSATPAAFVAGHKYIERGAAAFSEGAFALANAAANQTGAVDFLFLDMMFAKTAAVTGAVGVAAKGVEKAARFVGKAALPAAALVGGVMGAVRDENALRGAGRGVVSAFDPTALVMNKGLAERAYDAAFGEADRPRSWTGTVNRQNPRTETHQGKGAIRSQPRSKSRSGSWDDSNAAPKGAGWDRFSSANAAFSGMQKTEGQMQVATTAPSGRGWGHPVVQAAAQAARGRQFSGFKA